MKWETGLRAQIRTFESNQYNYFNGVLNPSISNNFSYTDYVYAGYATFSHKVKEAFSYQVGLRAESSNYDGEQIGKANYKKQFSNQSLPQRIPHKAAHQQSGHTGKLQPPYQQAQFLSADAQYRLF